MAKIRVHLKERSYDIVIGYGVIKDLGTILKRLGIGKDAVVITNRPLFHLYKKALEKSVKSRDLSIRFEIIPDSEKAKSSPVLTNILDRISAYDIHREIFIAAFGGGVVGDLAGFVAAVYKRGVPYVQIPTTLLGQVDSAIGGKVAIDLPIAKNLIGAFYQPRLVLSDIVLLRSLSMLQIKNGLSEIIKYGVIRDRVLFEFLEADYKKVLSLDRDALEFIVSRSSRIKADVVEKDEFDKKGVRVILNYGHTIGHAIEAASGYSKKFRHGEAVAIGMIGAARISSMLGLLKKEDANRIEALIRNTGLPTRIKSLKFLKIYEALLHDKKFIHRKNRFVLPIAIGNVKVVEGVPDRIVRDALRGLFQR